MRWLDASQKVFAENRQQLTDLDSAVGDGDFGISLDRGFTAVQAELSANPPADLRSVFQNVATVLIRTMGGTSGPLLGTFFLRAGAACAGKSELAPADVVALFQAGVEGIQQRGKAALGDKTMLDALLPAVDAMRSALEAGSGLAEILERGAAAAEAGMRATITMQARKGRGSYLGDRSIGHQDAGATGVLPAAESRCGSVAAVIGLVVVVVVTFRTVVEVSIMKTPFEIQCGDGRGAGAAQRPSPCSPRAPAPVLAAAQAPAAAQPPAGGAQAPAWRRPDHLLAARRHPLAVVAAAGVHSGPRPSTRARYQVRSGAQTS